MFISHHPFCWHYRYDTLRIGRYRFCSGCVFQYGGAFITLLALMVINLYSPLLPLCIFAMGLLMMMPLILQIFISLESIFFRRFVKLLAGIGGMLLISIPFIINTYFLLKLFLFIELVILFSFQGYSRLASIRRRCLKCIYQSNFSICPGFRIVSNRLRKNGIDHVVFLRKKNF